MDNAWITQLHRIQNRDLYTYYDIQRRRLLGQSGTTQDGKVAVTEAWHGTGSGDAANIYTDTQDGFMSETHAAGPSLALLSSDAACVGRSAILVERPVGPRSLLCPRRGTFSRRQRTNRARIL